jgi:adenosylmethionine-8-amino-7-oxononanoate aminotransferase
MVCLAKGLSGGYVPLGVTVSAEFLFEGFRSPHRVHALQNGHSTCGNALACTAADAALTLLENPLCAQQRQQIESQHLAFQTSLAGHPKVDRCVVHGTILALDYRTGEANSYYHSKRDVLARFFREEKVLLRPFGNCVSVVPPYCISSEQLQRIYQVIEKSLEII